MGRTENSGSTPPRSLGPFLFLWASLAAATAFFLVQPFVFHHSYYGPRSTSGSDDWWVVAALFAPYAYAIRRYLRGGGPSAAVLLAAVAVLYVALIPAPALQSQDVYQYLLYGKMALHGHNPYVVHPAGLRDPWRAWTLWNDTLSVYGPLWTLLTAGVVKAAGQNLTAAFLAMKAVAAGVALLAAGLLAAAAGGSRDGKGSFVGAADPGFAVLAFAYNPMVLFAAGLGAHTDLMVAALLAGAVAAYGRGRDVPSTLLIAMAALVKAYAGLVLIAWLLHLWRRRGLGASVGHASLVAAAAVLAYLPFWHGAETFTGVADIGRIASTSLAGTIVRLASGHAWAAYAAGASTPGEVVRVLGLLLIAAALVTVARSPRTGREPWRAGAILFWVYVVVTPWYLAWHLIGLVALAVACADEVVLWSTLTFSATSLYVGTGGTVAGLVLQTAVRYVPPGVVATRTLRSERRVNARGSNGRPDVRSGVPAASPGSPADAARAGRRRTAS